MIVKMALYCLKPSSVEFSAHLDETLDVIGLLSTKVDPDVSYQPAVKPNGFEYYKYILCYVNDILCMSHNPGIMLGWMHAIFKFKGDNMEQPKLYLGDQVGQMIVYGAEGWYMSADKYVRYAVENVEQNITKSNQRLSTRCKNPIIFGYWP